MSDEEYAPAKTKAPASLLDFLQFLAPVAKYYVLLMVAYFVAKRVNRALDEESALQDKEQLLVSLRWVFQPFSSGSQLC